MIDETMRTIYEQFWQKGQLPVTKTISIERNADGVSARVRALSYDVPTELLDEETLESLQAMIDDSHVSHTITIAR